MDRDNPNHSLYDELTAVADGWSRRPDAAAAMSGGDVIVRRRRLLTGAAALCTAMALAAGGGALAAVVDGGDSLQVADSAQANCSELLDDPLPMPQNEAEVASLLTWQDLKTARTFLDNLGPAAGPGPSVAHDPDGAPVIQVGFMTDPCRHAAELKKRLAEPETLRVFASEIPRQLTANVIEAIVTAGDLRMWSWVGPDPRTGYVTVELRENTPENRAAVLAVVSPGGERIISFTAAHSVDRGHMETEGPSRLANPCEPLGTRLADLASVPVEPEVPMVYATCATESTRLGFPIYGFPRPELDQGRDVVTIKNLVTAYFVGLTSEERHAGYGTAVSDRDPVNRVVVNDGHVTVDFSEDLNRSSQLGARAFDAWLIAELSATLLQYADSIQFTIEGSCAEFAEAVGMVACPQPITRDRPPGTIGASDSPGAG